MIPASEIKHPFATEQENAKISKNGTPRYFPRLRRVALTTLKMKDVLKHSTADD